MKKDKLLIAKIGGSIVEDEKALDTFLLNFSKITTPKILIHGGGKLATQLADKLGIKTEMIDGRRITSKDHIDIVIQTYAGLINKRVVAKLQANETNALGLSGADANVIEAIKRPVKFVDYGFVGDIIKVNSEMVSNFINLGITPVFCAVTHDCHGQLLNTNADTIASRIASAMANIYDVSLFYCFDLLGVMRDIHDENSLIEHMDQQEYMKLRDTNIISDGMLPKLQNCFDALENNVTTVHIARPEFIKDPTIKHTTLRL